MANNNLQVENLFSIKDKVVVITGGARGLGLMIAQTFVDNGAKVIIASRNADQCEKSAKELSKRGSGSCYALAADLSKESECKRLAEEIKKREDHIDVLINNSGAVWGETIDNFPEGGWDKVMNLNLKGVFFLTKYLLPLLEKSYEKHQSPARVINISSINSLNVPELETYSYSASKAGLNQLTRHLAGKLAGRHVLVNAIACGPFETKMMDATLKTFGDYVINSMPLKRIGRASDIGGTCVFLSSKASEWMTGTIIPLEGGGLVKPSL